jgi:hypothetical protein
MRLPDFKVTPNCFARAWFRVPGGTTDQMNAKGKRPACVMASSSVKGSQPIQHFPHEVQLNLDSIIGNSGG